MRMTKLEIGVITTLIFLMIVSGSIFVWSCSKINTSELEFAIPIRVVE